MKKEEFIRIRVAGWQKKYISLQAEKAHKSLSQYVRDAAMDKDVTVIDGVDVKTLSGALGHYDAGFTLSTYTHATEGMKRSAADAIGNVISQAM